MAFVFLEHANVPRVLFKVLKLAKAIELSMLELADVLQCGVGHLSETMELTVEEFTLEYSLAPVLHVDPLTYGLTILKLALIYVT